MKGIIGRKLGMTQVFEESGRQVSVTALQAGPCTVTALRSQEKDGYSAVQLGFGRRSHRRVSKAVKGHLRTSGLDQTPPLTMREIRLAEEGEMKLGETIGVDIFEPGEHVDVSGRSKGRGFQGVVKRYNFGGGRASHGGGWLRRPGSIGMCVSPGKVYKGRKMPGRMGGGQRTSQNLRVVAVRPEDNVMLVEGAVPGASGGLVLIREAVKKSSRSG